MLHSFIGAKSTWYHQSIFVTGSPAYACIMSTAGSAEFSLIFLLESGFALRYRMNEDMALLVRSN
jgi:hypothetical protein